MKKSILFLFALLSATVSLHAQCPSGFDRVRVIIVPDQYPQETSWYLADQNGTVFLSGTSNSDSVCVPSGTCLRFHIADTYGDGICCAYGIGSYSVYLNNNLAVTGGSFAFFEDRYIACPPGSNCDNTLAAVQDTIYQANGRSVWYAFTPDSTGSYAVSTCFPANTCNTQLWVYDHCAGLQFDTTNIGTIFYNEDACGLQAFVNANLQAGITYYIRVGGHSDCTDSTITWQIQYAGPIVGCTDPAACNYNPLATVSNGNCIYPGNPNCNSGPDLAIDQADLQNSISVGTVNGNDACLIGEGCLAGYGLRNIINFTTTIRNIGDADYYIGPPQAGNSQFVFDQCHGHWHYAGYASYELYDSLQQPMSVGFKNGFCVLDLMCFGGTAKYGCSDMGISAGCADSYSSGLSCQWMDITDVPAGHYTLVVKVNWDQSPDKLGRVEQRFDNNVGYVCLNISRNAQNIPSVTVIPSSCSPIVDCAGDTFGLAQPDCDGVCNGSRVSGDLNADSLRDAADIDLYMNGILNGLAVVKCNDLNSDSLLTIADAAWLNECIRNTNGSHSHPGGTQNTHRHCQFPFDIVNTTDTVLLGLGVSSGNSYLDIRMQNKDCDVLGVEFSLSDVVIDSVVSLVSGYDPLIRWNMADGHVVVLDTAENYITKHSVAFDAFRVYYSSLTSNVICMSSITETINGDYERTLHDYLVNCVVMSGVEVAYNSRQVKVQPNPSRDVFNIAAEALAGKNVELTVTDVTGRAVLRSTEVFNSGKSLVDLSGMPEGVYLLRLESDNQIYSTRIIKR